MVCCSAVGTPGALTPPIPGGGTEHKGQSQAPSALPTEAGAQGGPGALDSLSAETPCRARIQPRHGVLSLIAFTNEVSLLLETCE